MEKICGKGWPVSFGLLMPRREREFCPRRSSPTDANFFGRTDQPAKNFKESLAFANTISTIVENWLLN